MSGRRRGEGLAWNVVRETLLARSAELDGLISIRGAKDVHGSFGLAFLLLLTVPSVQKTSTPANTVFIRVPRELSFNWTSASSSDLRRVKSRISSCSAWIRSSKRSERGNIIGYVMALSIPSTSFPTESHLSPTLVDVPIP